MFEASNRIKNMIPSATVSLTARVNELKESGVNIITFAVGDPDFNTPKNVIDAAIKAKEAGHTHYTTCAGTLELRKAICEKLKRENNIEYKPSQIVVSTGAKQALNNACLVLCNPGDEVIIPSPCWVSYIEIVKLADAVPVIVETLEEEDFQIDVKKIEAAITPKTKAIMINSPNNPCGTVYKPEVLKALGELAVKHGIYIIADEVYEKLVFGDAKFVAMASFSKEIYDYTITINGLSLIHI